MSVVKIPPVNISRLSKPIVYCISCRAQLWFKDGPMINDGVWCAACSSWNEAREIKQSFAQSLLDLVKGMKIPEIKMGDDK